MNNSRFEWKVGLFVFVGLVLIAVLMLNFSKGITFLQPTYELHVVMPTVSGLKPKANVMMAGVPVGTVAETALSENGKSVDITVRILSKYKIYPGSRFYIDALGFLGDQYVAVTPPDKIESQQALTNGAVVYGEAPFNLQEAVRTTSDLLDQARQTMRNLDQAITNVNRTVLNEKTMAEFGNALRNFEQVTETAIGITKDAQALLRTNIPAANAAVSNLNSFSRKLNAVADTLSETVSTNRGDVSDAIQNFREASSQFKKTAEELQAGKGVAGSLLKDEQLKEQTAQLIHNANAVAYNLNLFSSNLNQRGLWAMLRRPKEGQTNAPSTLPLRSWPGKH